MTDFPVPRLRVRPSAPSAITEILPAIKPILIEQRSADQLTKSPHRVRKIKKRQLGMLVGCIRRYGCLVPILVTPSGEIIDGHAVYEACLEAGLKQVPTIVVSHLTPAEIRACRIALNRAFDLGEWDYAQLKVEVEFILETDINLTMDLGFDMAEVDKLLLLPDLADRDDEPAAPTPAVSRAGDLWLFQGGHRLLCGTAVESASYETLLGSERAQMVFADLPYGCKIEDFVSRTHGNFVQGAGDMTKDELREFYRSIFKHSAAYSNAGSIHFSCIDYRSMKEMLDAGFATYCE